MPEPCREPLPAGEKPDSQVDVTYRVGSSPPTQFPPTHNSLERRFLSRVDTSGDCWLWRGGQTGLGYGCGPNREYAHRWAYRHFIGPIPDGKIVMHSCDQPRCVYPGHLSVATQTENMMDAVRKGRRITRYTALVPSQVSQIRALYTQGITLSELSRRFGPARKTLRQVVRHEIWKSVP